MSVVNTNPAKAHPTTVITEIIPSFPITHHLLNVRLPIIANVPIIIKKVATK
jgi:hypothetical protein